MSFPSLHKFERLPLLVSAVVAFLLLPLVVVLAVNLQDFQTNRNLQNKKTVSTSQTKLVEHFLTLDQPEDNLVAQNPNLTVSGKTTASSTVVIIAGETTQLLEVGPDGNFSFDLTLDEGATTIEVTSFDQNGEEKNVTREVFYSTEEI